MSRPERDEARGQPGSEEQTQNDTSIIGQVADERKAQTTLAAMLEMKGYSLHDLAGVRAFYGRLGGAS